MVHYKEIPDLLVQYMEMCEESERWITVYEFRTYFHLDESSAHAISGFLNRICYRSFLSYPYRVKKIEKIIMYTPTRRIINRYLVKKAGNKGKEAGHPQWQLFPGVSIQLNYQELLIKNSSRTMMPLKSSIKSCENKAGYNNNGFSEVFLFMTVYDA